MRNHASKKIFLPHDNDAGSDLVDGILTFGLNTTEKEELMTGYSFQSWPGSSFYVTRPLPSLLPPSSSSPHALHAYQTRAPSRRMGATREDRAGRCSSRSIFSGEIAPPPPPTGERRREGFLGREGAIWGGRRFCGGRWVTMGRGGGEAKVYVEVGSIDPADLSEPIHPSFWGNIPIRWTVPSLLKITKHIHIRDDPIRYTFWSRTKHTLTEQGLKWSAALAP
jgi:hypothetical protein